MTKSSVPRCMPSMERTNGAPGARSFNPRELARRRSALDDRYRDPGRPLKSADCLWGVVSHPTVKINPQNSVTRRTLTWRGVTAESIRRTGPDTAACWFRGPLHLLAAYDQAPRTNAFVEGLHPLTPGNSAHSLTFVPAGHEYREVYKVGRPTRLTLLYLEPAHLDLGSQAGDTPVAPRLMFEDPMLWNTISRLNSLLENTSSADRCYFEALGIVLVHDLSLSNRTASAVWPISKGGLAGWQRRVITAYIEEHFAERTSLAKLAQLVRLSPYHFCRAFKHSFGMPPLRYQNLRRIEHAKRLLTQREMSVTDIGLDAGFGSLGSFDTAFRRVTGLSPSAYSRFV